MLLHLEMVTVVIGRLICIVGSTLEIYLHLVLLECVLTAFINIVAEYKPS